jgi:hypothetical protein
MPERPALRRVHQPPYNRMTRPAPLPSFVTGLFHPCRGPLWIEIPPFGIKEKKHVEYISHAHHI